MSNLQDIKDRTWFYEFDLPDGTVTNTDIPSEVRMIHVTRREILRRVIAENISDSKDLTAIDLASHEGWFSLELAKHFRHVTGIEIRDSSITAAELISSYLSIKNVKFLQADISKIEYNPAMSRDFVLLYGLLYHVENPIHLLRLSSQLARRAILVETQVFPYEITGWIEDGHYEWQRQVHGVFSVSADYPSQREGGSTNIALIPSLNALIYLLKTFGFDEIKLMKVGTNDYEQFRRHSRVIVYGEKNLRKY